MIQNTETPTIACSLPTDARKHRVEAWREVASKALHRDAQPGRLISTYPKNSETAERLAQLVDAERECCAFLDFDVQEGETVITVEVRYPPQFAAMLEAVLT